MRLLVIILGLALAASAATYARYGSLDPCDWLVEDTAAADGMPRLMAQARVRAAFLLDGITDPSPGQCVRAWWTVRSEGTSAE